MDDKGILNEIFEKKVHFVGDKNFGTWESQKINNLIKKFVEIYADKFGEESFQELKIDFKVMNKQGLQREYEIKVLFVTDRGSYHAKKTGWDVYNTFRESLEAIENQVFN